MMYFPTFDGLGFPELLTIIAGTAFLIQVITYLIHFLPLSLLRNTHPHPPAEPRPVSVVICARNEEDNLPEFLPKVLTQDYPDFEVVVVDDCSTDNTGHVIDAIAKNHPRLRKAEIKEDAYYKHGKKFAMLVGIKSAKHDHIVFTDADCYPASDQWLRHMAGGFGEGREIVLGYGAYEKREGFLNTLIRYDTFSIAALYLSAALRRRAYMGVGRNLAYTRPLFFRHKGFANHYHLQSGDDDLFVNAAATPANTSVAADPAALTLSRPKTTFRAWRLQKARHLSTAAHYTSGSRSRLVFHHFTQYFFLAALIACAFSVQTLVLIPALLLLKTFMQAAVLGKSAKRLGERDLLWGSAFCELALLFIYPIFHISKILAKRARWTN